MGLILPDPRLETPELLYPGRKPTGTVAIDASHYGLRHIDTWLFRGNTVSEEGLRSVRTGNDAYKIGQIYLDGNGDYVQLTNDATPFINPETTVFIDFTVISYTVNDRVFDCKTVYNGTSGFSMETSNGFFRMLDSGGAERYDFTEYAIRTGERVVMALSMKTGATAMYIGGSFSHELISGDMALAPGANSFYLGRYGGAVGSEPAIQVNAFSVFEGYLDKTPGLAFTADPYKCMFPA